MDLFKARHIAIELMTLHGVHPEWTFKFDNSRMRHGQAKTGIVHKKPVKQISASRHITELSSEEGFRDTILHEIAHVLVGLEHQHDKVWHDKAIEIGSSGKEFSDEEMSHIATLARYHWVCTGDYHPIRFTNKKLTTGLCCPAHPNASIEMVDMQSVA